MERVSGVSGERLMKNGEGRIPRKVANLNITQTATSGCWHVWGRVFLKVGICIDDET